MPEVILTIIFGSYLLLVLILMIGLNSKQRTVELQPVFISVIVPARNEGENIGACIESLLKQNYPLNQYEILIVNDGSEDDTAEIVRGYQAKDNRIHLLESSGESVLPPGKSRALERGIRAAQGEIILNTDADCAVTEDWLWATLALYRGQISMVNGVTLPNGKGWFAGIQTLDFAFLHAVAAGFSGLGLSLAGMGNNMSYRKQSYLKNGGFEKLGFSVTEDFQLTRAFLASGEGVAHFASDKTLVTTKPMETMTDLFNQKKRWVAGGLNSPHIFYLLFLAAWLSIIGCFAAPFFMGEGWVYLPASKFVADFLLIWLLLSKVKMRGALRYFLHFELYLSVYVLIFPLIVPFSREVRWKGRIFR